jgi:hypothetical protein
MMRNMNVEVVKVAVDRPASRQKKHGSSPRLYLELVENKDKVKQDLVNKEFVPKEEPEETLSDLEDEPIAVENNEGGEPSVADDKHSDQSDDRSSIFGSDNDDGADEFAERRESSKEQRHQRDESVNNRISDMIDNSPSEKNPPSLFQVTGGEKKYYRDVSQVSKNEIDEEDEKRQLLFKFDLMRRQYTESATLIPEYTVHSDLRVMQRSYETTLQRVVLDSTVEDYKGYFQKGCFAVEFLLNYFGFDISGFTGDQMSKMNAYERLLVELCAKHYNPAGSSIPVELRLLGMIFMNAALFIGMKIMAKKFETGGPPASPPPASAGSQPEPRKMRGPQNIGVPVGNDKETK